jgi:hypothetical protein
VGIGLKEAPRKMTRISPLLEEIPEKAEIKPLKYAP